MRTDTKSYYRDASGEATLKDQGFMMEWAERAGKLVFQEVEDMFEDNIVSFVNLALFWHSQGSWRRSYLHKGRRECCAYYCSYLSLRSKRLQPNSHTRHGCHTKTHGTRLEVRAPSPTILGVLSNALPYVRVFAAVPANSGHGVAGASLVRGRLQGSPGPKPKGIPHNQACPRRSILEFDPDHHYLVSSHIYKLREGPGLIVVSGLLYWLGSERPSP